MPLINELSPDAPDQPDAPGQNTEAVGNGTVTPPTTGALLMYATLPLGIGLSANAAQCISRLDWKQYATAPLLVLVLLDANGLPVNLTGFTSVTLRLLPALGGDTLISEAMTVLYATGGQVSYRFVAGDVADAGTFYLEVEAIDASGFPMYFPSDGAVLFVLHPSLGGP